MASPHLECPGAAGNSSIRSRSSGSSTSSLSSTFSDLTSSTSASSSSPPNLLKTNAFFASPFSTRSPSPTLPTPVTPAQNKPRSLTAEFFGTPVRPPSPPASSMPTKHSVATPHISRIFPSRYTSVPDRSPDFNLNLLNFDSVSDETPKFNAHTRTPSTGSSSSFSSSSFHSPRLPTPPPSHERTPHRGDTLVQGDFPPTPRQQREHEQDNCDELTPRPADRQPGLLRFERDLILERQANQKLKLPPKPPPEPLEEQRIDDSGVDEEPHPGSIISLPSPESRPSHLPLSPLSLTFTIASPSPTFSSRPLDRGTPTPTNEYSMSSVSLKSSPELKPLPSPPPSVHSHTHTQSMTPVETSQTPYYHSTLSSAPLPAKDTDKDNGKEKDHTQVPKLRLLRPLGHGAFSAVWLAEDLSRVPLTLVSKKSVRDLRRRASGREREREKERERDMEMGIQRPRWDNGEKPTASPITSVNGAEAPSRNRLKEGLKNMLSFSRSAALGIGAMTTSPISSGPSPISPMTALGSDSGDDDGGALSRNSSIRSTSLSRQSSVRSSTSSTGPSRASSLRLAPPQQDMTLSRDSSLKKFRERVRGTRPAFRLGRAYLDERHGEMGEPRDVGTGMGMGSIRRFDGDASLSMDSEDDGVGLGASLSRQSSMSSGKGNGRLVAVKMTPRRATTDVPGHAQGKGLAMKRQREEEERTRVGFVREVEVLKHISHPNITPLLAHLSTASHHILVLPYLPGGDLLGLVNNDVAWGMLSESVLRRIWCEICKAVGWMHGVGLVHRDIKLENILLTTTAFSSLTSTSPRPVLSTLPTPPAPFIKLTDFGLSRFVEIDANGEAELLSTRCGSEAYAAPELVTGGGGGAGVYDARRTDAWACGVVLYALVGRQLPFGEGVVVGAGVGGGSKIGGERVNDGATGFGGSRRATAADRRHWLMRIARGEWEWPGGDDGHVPGGEGEVAEENEQELVGSRLCHSRGAKRIVSRLLVRDPKKRARVGDLWDDAWMQGGEDEAWWREKEARMRLDEDAVDNGDWESHWTQEQHEAVDDMQWTFDGNPDALRDDVDIEFYDEPSHLGQMGLDGEEEEEDERLEEEEEGGCLFDHEGIDSITRQEVI